MDPRPYQSSDREACLAVFDSNLLAHRDFFERYLDGNPTNFTVLEHEGVIVGCGGYRIENGSAALIHGIIRRDVQHMGLGRFLLLYRLRQISKSDLEVGFARLSTTPQSAPFYQKQGFKPAGSETAESVDLVMKLTVCP